MRRRRNIRLQPFRVSCRDTGRRDDGFASSRAARALNAERNMSSRDASLP